MTPLPFSLCRNLDFFYVSQFAIKASKFFDADRNSTEKLYFNLDWETVSRSRISYELGWKMLESNLKMLFSHVNILEMLNANDNEDKYDYPLQFTNYR